MKYLNLKALTKKYEQLFIDVCEKIEKYGGYDYLTEYNELKEVCFELSVDTKEIEKYIF